MPNIAIIFAGGTGKRMHTKSTPKQFLTLHGKPILAITAEAFNSHPEIDGIILAVLEAWIPYCREIKEKYHLDKIADIVPGGGSALQTQRNALERAEELFGGQTVVLIHDGVRPMLDAETISGNIASVRARGSAITVAPAIETIVLKNDDGAIGTIIERSRVELARAPQSFYLKDILAVHGRAREDGLEFIDSASMMQHYGRELYTVEGPPENIKITTPNDFYMFRALYDAKDIPEDS